VYRTALEYLAAWRTRPSRKPLILRGARQVGKTHLVRRFAAEHFDRLVELNFERDPELASLFAGNDPGQTVQRLELEFDGSMESGAVLLFLDEIQAAPLVLTALRYFREERPELHVVAAGSLLDHLLEDHALPMPVGRVEYLHLGPMTFEEFLLAAGRERLARFLGTLAPDGAVPAAIHDRLMGLLRQYLATGGMPEAVGAFLAGGSYRDCEAVQQSILSTYQDDFGRYGRRTDQARLVKVFRSLPRLVGSRFKYVHVDREERSKDLARALHLLCLARVAYRVRHSASNGLPLAAEAREARFKPLFLDVGLMLRALGLNLLDLERHEDVLLVNAGAVCEQLVGQHLMYSGPPYAEPELHFWAREKRNATAEVDYVISESGEVVPVEVKRGKTGTLRSLHLFLREKRRGLGVRLNSEPPSLLTATATLPDSRRLTFRLLSLPLYLVGQVRRMVQAVVHG